MGVFEQNPWLYCFPVAVVLLGVAAVWLLLARRKNRRAAYVQWQAYLDNIETSLHNLSDLEKGLRPYFEGPDKKMSEPGFQLHRIVQGEVEALRHQLDGFLSFDDYLYANAPIDWRPFPPVAGHLSALAGLAGDTVAATRKETDSAKSRFQTLESNLGNLESQNRDLGKHMKELASRFSQLAEVLPEDDETLFRRARGSISEESIAAQMMAELQGGLPEPEISTRLAEVDEEITQRKDMLARNGLSTSEREDQRGRLDWLLQVRRWWRLQQRLVNQDNLLKECQGTIEEIVDADYRERLQSWLDSLKAREEIDDLHDKIGDLTVQRRMAWKYLERLQEEQGGMRSMGNTLHRIQGLNASSGDEIENMKQTLEEVGSAFRGATLNREQLQYYEEGLAEARRREKVSREEVRTLRVELNETRETRKMEKTKFEQTLKIMEEALEKATMEKKELTQGFSQLRESYGMLKKRLEERR